MSTLTDKAGAPVEVRLTPGGDAYGIYVEGREAWVGAAFFLDRAYEGVDQRIFHHTEVGDDFSGRGLAGVLVREALAETFAQGLTVVPACPYVKSYIEKKGLDGPVSAPTSEVYGWVEENK
ncbi:MAG TPA: N-acetyltransferase [Candidatus Corynebacterium avicola]|uniref:N-acetyltransferase n=1 Tax=Candidatus Corynebacterium avicola TaxID=2838527 RepID=A0A9D1RPH8_9CORY|nr:N-acetyltransferase [Candidatus Corynebacterium avicola]